MRYIFLMCLFPMLSQAQSYAEAIAQHRKELNAKFSDTATTPLDSADLFAFEGLEYFKPDSSYRVVAEVEPTPDSLPFEMPTSTKRMAKYRQFALLHFRLRDSSFTLPLYRNLKLAKMPQYQDYYFLPFTDLTNGFSTYGGGRYLDIRYSSGDSVVVDFNKAYNPYCAYSARYSCPIPPEKI